MGARKEVMAIIMTETITREIDLSDEELTAFMDRHGCPPADEGFEPIERFMEWSIPYEAEKELRELSEITEEDVEYDTE